MAIEVFNRVEMKFPMDTERYKHITEFLAKYMNYDEYNPGGKHYTIANIYYDTVDNDLIRISVQKPRYKEKLRLRAYGVPDLTSKTFLEIKKKYNGVVNKRRVTLPLATAYEFVNTGEVPKLENQKYVTKQVLQELKHTIWYYKPVPKLYLAYDRVAYFGKPIEEGGPGRDLRISFDFNVRTRREEVGLELGDHGEQLLEKGQFIMEVKAGESLPRWFLDYLRDNNMRKGSYSKYGVEYSRFLRRQIEAGIIGPNATVPNYTLEEVQKMHKF